MIKDYSRLILVLFVIGIGMLLFTVIVGCKSSNKKKTMVSTGLVRVYVATSLLPSDDVAMSEIPKFSRWLNKFRTAPHKGNWNSDGTPMINPQTGLPLNDSRPHDADGVLIVCHLYGMSIGNVQPVISDLYNGTSWTAWIWYMTGGVSYYIDKELPFPQKAKCGSWIKDEWWEPAINIYVYNHGVDEFKRIWVEAEFTAEMYK